MSSTNRLTQGTIPKDKISFYFNRLWNQVALPMTYQKVNLLRADLLWHLGRILAVAVV